jgi:DNA modification methylase
MKKVVQLMEYLKARNVSLSLLGDNIKFRGPKQALTPAIMDEMKSHKAEIISYLNLKTAPDGTPLRNSILLGDSQHWLKSVPDDSIDLMVTDPPYGMKFMGKAWDKALPKVEIWKECLRVLKPGAFAFVMCIPRQDLLGRMIADLEAAGFDAGFTSIYWTFASGFPKAQNISKAIDKKAGAAGKIIGRNPNSRENCDQSNTIYESGTVGKTAYITLPATETARIFEGAYAGFQPKPAVEVILVAMKPVIEGTYTEQAKSNGKGITWLDDCRIPYSNPDEIPTTSNIPEGGFDRVDDRGRRYKLGGNGYKYFFYKGDLEKAKIGRFPANLLVSDDVLDDGNTKIGDGSLKIRQAQTGAGILAQYDGRKTMPKIHDGLETIRCINDSGTFSRFFSLDAWAEKNLPFLMVPKASKREKDAGIEGAIKEIDTRTPTAKGSMVAKGLQPGKNIHPTVKPIKLMAYLVTMGSRGGDVVLDPFCGSGTTCIAAMMLNRNFIGMEIDPKYYQIALKRLEHHRLKMAAA